MRPARWWPFGRDGAPASRVPPELTRAGLDEEIRRFRSSLEYEALKVLKWSTSMLHEDVLIVLRYLARVTPGPILELGPYIGGSTISMALGLEGSRRLVTVEKGGAQAHPDLPSGDILADLRRNLARHGVADRVCVIEGLNEAAATLEAVRKALGSDKVGLFVIDSDGHVERDLWAYAPFCRPGCVVVVDDYSTDEAREKSALIQPHIDRMVAERRLEAVARYGWYEGTWIGRFA